MRVPTTGKGSALRESKAARSKRSSSAKFQIPDDQVQSNSTTASTSVSSVANIDAILSLQGIDDASGERKKAIDHGQATLDILDELKIGFLSGQISEARIKKLKHMVEQRPKVPDDSQLTDILDEIDLRAQVELAKLNMRKLLR